MWGRRIILPSSDDMGAVRVLDWEGGGELIE
jgi:hypothetical protein